MKKFGLLLVAVALVASATPAFAAVGLSINYTFDSLAIADGQGNLGGAASIGSGAGIGAGNLTVGNGGYYQMTTLTQPGAVGTESFWVNLTTATGGTVLWGMGNGIGESAGGLNHGQYVDTAGGVLHHWYRPDGLSAPASYSKGINTSGAATLVGNGPHLLTMTYSLAVGSGASALQTYLDGSLLTTATAENYLTTLANVNGFTNQGLFIDEGDTTKVFSAGVTGWVDDAARWTTVLDATNVKALYNLGSTGVAGVKYNATDASLLMDQFALAAGATTSNGVAWNYVPSGLVGAAGAVGSNYVVLNGATGGGMQGPAVVPEPGTISMLVAGALGLLVFAWRKRK